MISSLLVVSQPSQRYESTNCWAEDIRMACVQNKSHKDAHTYYIPIIFVGTSIKTYMTRMHAHWIFSSGKGPIASGKRYRTQSCFFRYISCWYSRCVMKSDKTWKKMWEKESFPPSVRHSACPLQKWQWTMMCHCICHFWNRISGLSLKAPRWLLQTRRSHCLLGSSKLRMTAGPYFQSLHEFGIATLLTIINHD